MQMGGAGVSDTQGASLLPSLITRTVNRWCDVDTAAVMAMSVSCVDRNVADEAIGGR